MDLVRKMRGTVARQSTDHRACLLPGFGCVFPRVLCIRHFIPHEGSSHECSDAHFKLGDQYSADPPLLQLNGTPPIASELETELESV